MRSKKFIILEQIMEGLLYSTDIFYQLKPKLCSHLFSCLENIPPKFDKWVEIRQKLLISFEKTLENRRLVFFLLK